ncbi:hypothetical protein V5O48_018247, partial [Marasmius crinis-equi]
SRFENCTVVPGCTDISLVASLWSEMAIQAIQSLSPHVKHSPLRRYVTITSTTENMGDSQGGTRIHCLLTYHGSTWPIPLNSAASPRTLAAWCTSTPEARFLPALFIGR